MVNNRRIKRWIRHLEETVKCCFGSGSEWVGQRFPTVFLEYAQGDVARFDFENKFLPTTIPN